MGPSGAAMTRTCPRLKSPWIQLVLSFADILNLSRASRCHRLADALDCPTLVPTSIKTGEHSRREKAEDGDGISRRRCVNVTIFRSSPRVACGLVKPTNDVAGSLSSRMARRARRIYIQRMERILYRGAECASLGEKDRMSVYRATMQKDNP